MSDLANASAALVGMIPRRKSVTLCPRPAVTYCATAPASSVAGSTFIPAPGFTTLTTIRPMTSATVLTISKYRSVRMPALPTAFTSPTPAMPTTTVQNTTGAMIIRTSLMNASPSGFIDAPADGRNVRRGTVAIRTWRVEGSMETHGRKFKSASAKLKVQNLTSNFALGLGTSARRTSEGPSLRGACPTSAESSAGSRLRARLAGVRACRRALRRCRD